MGKELRLGPLVLMPLLYFTLRLLLLTSAPLCYGYWIIWIFSLWEDNFILYTNKRNHVCKMCLFEIVFPSTENRISQVPIDLKYTFILLYSDLGTNAAHMFCKGLIIKSTMHRSHTLRQSLRKRCGFYSVFVIYWLCCIVALWDTFDIGIHSWICWQCVRACVFYINYPADYKYSASAAPVLYVSPVALSIFLPLKSPWTQKHLWKPSQSHRK